MDDLTEIFLYIAREDVNTATKFVDDLHQKIQWIADVDFSGAPRDWIRPNLRTLPYRKRCIYFRVNDHSVNILRILHNRQDITQQEFNDH
ncbi:MAG: type II toxin-antitoxin system RelE/ParE family toxin [Emcibacter sp.]|nr:type II toxin-antitoxin system RelE/ParE family toxin [Emcibacter sp.]